MNKNLILNVRKQISSTKQFLSVDIWRIHIQDIPKIKAFFIRYLRVIIVVIRGLNQNQCHLNASALTFYTLLSIVPVLAVAFGIAKGFGFEKLLERELYEKFPGQEEVLTQVVNFAINMLEKTKGGVIAGIGLAVLFWTVIKLLSNIERSFNNIWRIKKHRSFDRKFSDYLSIMMICPLLFIASSSVTVFIKTQITDMTKQVAILGYISPVIFSMLKLLPYCLIWVIFTLIYVVMPNKKINLISAIVGGIIAGTIYNIAQWAYIDFQVRMSDYNAIYGSFAALPLFFVWLQISWLIVLFGTEICFAHQNIDTFEFESDCMNISRRFKRIVSLQIAHAVIKRFSAGENPPTEAAISNLLKIPPRLTSMLLDEMVESNILITARGEEEAESMYLPARDINVLTIHFIIDALDRKGVEDLPVLMTNELKTISQSLETFSRLIETSTENRLIRDI